MDRVDGDAMRRTHHLELVPGTCGKGGLVDPIRFLDTHLDDLIANVSKSCRLSTLMHDQAL